MLSARRPFGPARFARGLDKFKSGRFITKSYMRLFGSFYCSHFVPHIFEKLSFLRWFNIWQMSSSGEGHSGCSWNGRLLHPLSLRECSLGLHLRDCVQINWTHFFQNGWASKKLAELSWFRVIVTNRISWSINRGWGYKNYEWIVHIWHSIQMSKNGRTLIWWLLWKFHFKKLRFCGHS